MHKVYLIIKQYSHIKIKLRIKNIQTHLSHTTPNLLIIMILHPTQKVSNIYAYFELIT